jgi:serine/threonine protein kinase
MQGNEATRVDNGDIERKSNEKLPIEQQSVIKNQGLMQIPNYEILEPIDEGGSAIVYKARRKKDSLLVAIKVPKVPYKDFVKELAVWLQLNDHPNIVKLLDYDINPRPYMVMELMNGTLHGKTFDKDTATRIILDVLSGLKYAHEKGIIHRDIKPSNILLDANGRAKISDWGIAKFSDITTTNEAFTLTYAAPEQLNKQLGPIDEKTDVYQVCEVFYEILTGRPVFQGDASEVYSKKLNMQITLPSSINPDLKDYDKIFLKCLSPKKEDRYSTEELISILSNMQYTRLTTKNTAYALFGPPLPPL